MADKQIITREKYYSDRKVYTRVVLRNNDPQKKHTFYCQKDTLKKIKTI